MSLASLRALTLTGPGGNTFAIMATRNASPDDRLDSFIGCAQSLSNREYWETLADIWILAHLPGYRRADWHALFGSQRPERAALMNASEQQTLAALPDPLRVYRAATVESRTGITWTLDLNIARASMSRRAVSTGDPQFIWTREVSKSQIAAYFDGHGQQEIVILGAEGIELHLAQIQNGDRLVPP